MGTEPRHRGVSRQPPVRRGWSRFPLLVAAVLLGCACLPAAPTAPAAPAAAAPPSAARVAASPAAQTPAGASSPAARVDRPRTRVTVGILGSATDVVFYLPEERGYFEQMRIEPVFERFDTGARMVAALASNQIEVGAGGPSVALYNAMARGVQVRLVADRVSSRPEHDTWQIVVRKDLAESGAIRDYPDLRDRRVGLGQRGITGEIVLARALERGGLTLGDVDITEMPYPDMAVALATGALDLGVTIEPFASIALQKGGAVLWRGAQELVPNQVSSVLMYTGSFAEQRPDVARDFMVAYLMGVRDYNAAFIKREPAALAQAQDMIVRRTDLRDLELAQRIRVGYINPNGNLDRAALAADYEWFRQYGGLTETVDLDQVVDDSFVGHAVSVLGPYR
jgi:NitT/TauT family transport system substrate-binding protein